MSQARGSMYAKSRPVHTYPLVFPTRRGASFRSTLVPGGLIASNRLKFPHLLARLFHHCVDGLISRLRFLLFGNQSAQTCLFFSIFLISKSLHYLPCRQPKACSNWVVAAEVVVRTPCGRFETGFETRFEPREVSLTFSAKSKVCTIR